MMTTATMAIKICEEILNRSKAYNIEKSILPSENLVIDRLLASRENMQHVYIELVELLDRKQIDSFLSLILSCAAFWNPEKAVLYRKQKKELVGINEEIAKTASELANLLEKRYMLHNESALSSDHYYHIIDVMEETSRDDYLFNNYLQEPLSQLRGRFDLKYWPTLSQIVKELATDASKVKVYATDSLTEASINSTRASKVDFLRALFSAIHENSEREQDILPKGFQLSDKAFAEIMNCALHLESDELVDASYVKGERQKQRASESMGSDSID